jgi:hypothetical protein
VDWLLDYLARRPESLDARKLRRAQGSPAQTGAFG